MTEPFSSHSNGQDAAAGGRPVQQYPILLLLILVGLLLGAVLADPWGAWVNWALTCAYDGIHVRGSSPLGFAGHLIAASVPGAKSLYAADLDGDGDLDVVSLGTRGPHELSQVAWHENVAQDGSAWATHLIGWRGAAALEIRDLDRDGDLDLRIEPLDAEQECCPWFENNGRPRPQFSLRTGGPGSHGSSSDLDPSGERARVRGLLLDTLGDPLIADSLASEEDTDLSPALTWNALVRRAAAGDLDADGDVDLVLVIPERGLLSWYENDGQPSIGLTVHVMSNYAYGAGNVCVADVDGDGDLDVLAGFMGGRIVWWEQVRRHSALAEHTEGAAAEDGALSVD